MLARIDFGVIWHELGKLWGFKLWTIEKDHVTIGKLITAFIVIAIGFIVARIVRRIVRRYLVSGGKINAQESAVVGKVVFLFIIVTAFFLALKIVHLPLATFAFLGGALAVGLGFGCKDLINNFVSGFVLMAEQPVRIGDVVEVEIPGVGVLTNSVSAAVSSA